LLFVKTRLLKSALTDNSLAIFTALVATPLCSSRELCTEDWATPDCNNPTINAAVGARNFLLRAMTSPSELLLKTTVFSIYDYYNNSTRYGNHLKTLRHSKQLFLNDFFIAGKFNTRKTSEKYRNQVRNVNTPLRGISISTFF
jgi:hypothetical protein